MKKILILAAIAALFVYEGRVNYELAVAEEQHAKLIECANLDLDMSSDMQCDSCFHAIYGEEADCSENIYSSCK